MAEIGIINDKNVVLNFYKVVLGSYRQRNVAEENCGEINTCSNCLICIALEIYGVDRRDSWAGIIPASTQLGFPNQLEKI